MLRYNSVSFGRHACRLNARTSTTILMNISMLQNQATENRKWKLFLNFKKYSFFLFSSKVYSLLSLSSTTPSFNASQNVWLCCCFFFAFIIFLLLRLNSYTCFFFWIVIQGYNISCHLIWVCCSITNNNKLLSCIHYTAINIVQRFNLDEGFF